MESRRFLNASERDTRSHCGPAPMWTIEHRLAPRSVEMRQGQSEDWLRTLQKRQVDWEAGGRYGIRVVEDVIEKWQL